MKLIYRKMADGQESAKGKENPSVGVRGYGKTDFPQEVKTPQGFCELS